MWLFFSHPSKDALQTGVERGWEGEREIEKEREKCDYSRVICMRQVKVKDHLVVISLF